MRSEFLPFSRPDISEKEIGAVADVLRSGWITTGPKTALFEERFREYVGAPGAVALASGTGGMHLALMALGIGPGDEVITPSMTWVSTVNLIVLAGATPVFADIDRDTLMVTADTIEERLSERTKLIIPVHFAGAPADMEPIRKLAADRGLDLIEDAAHALGTEYRGERVGRRSTAVFSFHPIKNITTGEGGMLCSDDTALLDRIRRLRFHGLGADAYDRRSHGRSPMAEVLDPGLKYNMTDISAAMGIVQLERLEEFSRKRSDLAAGYMELLEDIEEIIPVSDPPYPMRHSRHLFIVRLDTAKAGISRDELMARLRDRNIGTGLHFLAVHLHRYYRETMEMSGGALPNTEWNSERICSLPLFPGMTMEDVEDVVGAVKDVLRKSDG